MSVIGTARQQLISWSASPLIPPLLGNELVRVRARRAVRKYLRDRDDGWGYEMWRSRCIRDTLRDDALLNRFRFGEPLPTGYGVELDERCVEYPWLFTHLSDRPGTLLDAGSTLNHREILDQPTLSRKAVHIMTLGPERECFWSRSISYIFGDLRAIPIRDGHYDEIACLSVLEHIGLDNTHYVADLKYKESTTNDFILVMRELQRVLKPSGTLFLTVPFGAYRNHGWLQIFDRRRLSLAIDAFDQAAEVSEVFYRWSPTGWNIATADECAACDYSMGSMPNRARAVACVRFVKRRS